MGCGTSAVVLAYIPTLLYCLTLWGYCILSGIPFRRFHNSNILIWCSHTAWIHNEAFLKRWMQLPCKGGLAIPNRKLLLTDIDPEYLVQHRRSFHGNQQCHLDNVYMNIKSAKFLECKSKHAGVMEVYVIPLLKQWALSITVGE